MCFDLHMCTKDSSGYRFSQVSRQAFHEFLVVVAGFLWWCGFIKRGACSFAYVPEKRKLTYNEKKEYENIESEIDALEQEKVLIGEQFNDPSLDAKKIKDLGMRIKELDHEIASKTDRWMELAELI